MTKTTETLYQFLRSPRKWLAGRRADRRAVEAWRRARARRNEPRDPLWADFQEAALRADMERLAEIGDWVRAGCPINLFTLGEYERLVVEGYVAAGGDE